MTDRDKSHRRALNDIGRQATDDRIPRVAFAAFVYGEDTEFTHSTVGDATVGEVLDGLSSHVAALSEVTGESVDDILGATLDMAREKRRAGHGEWNGPEGSDEGGSE